MVFLTPFYSMLAFSISLVFFFFPFLLSLYKSQNERERCIQFAFTGYGMYLVVFFSFSFNHHRQTVESQGYRDSSSQVGGVNYFDILSFWYNSETFSFFFFKLDHGCQVDDCFVGEQLSSTSAMMYGFGLIR